MLLRGTKTLMASILDRYKTIVSLIAQIGNRRRSLSERVGASVGCRECTIRQAGFDTQVEETVVRGYIVLDGDGTVAPHAYWRTLCEKTLSRK